MLDHRITKHHRFHTHPLITVVRDGVGIDAMRGDELVVHDHIGARCAQVAVGARAVAQSAQQLHFQRDREILRESHAGRRLRMHHDAVVANGPAIATAGAGHLCAHEAVLHRHDVVRERLLGEQVTELAVEIRPRIVPHFQQSVFGTERVAEVLPHRMPGELDVPVGKILAVE